MIPTPFRTLIVSPVFNEESVIAEFIEEFLKFNKSISSVQFKLLLINDGSTDGSMDIIRKYQNQYSTEIGFVSFAANYGHQAALMAGLGHVDAWPDLIVTMDSDLEHPFSVIETMIHVYRKEKPVLINAIRNDSSTLKLQKRFLSSFFYKFARLATGLSISKGQADFRAWDADFIRQLKGHLSRLSSLRLFASWIPGIKKDIPYDQPFQTIRPSRFTFKKNVTMAVTGLMRFSNLPFKLFGLIGAVGILFSVVYGIYSLVMVSQGNVVRGWPSLMMTVMFFGCLQLLSIGILGYYMKYLIFDRDLPIYIVKDANLFESSVKEPSPN